MSCDSACDRGRGARVERAAHVGRRRVVDDFANEPAGERQLARRIAAEQAVQLGIGERGLERLARHHRAQQVELRLDAEHGRGLQHVARRLREHRQPRGDQVGQRDLACPRPCRPRAGSARRARRGPGYARVVSNSCCTGGRPRTPAFARLATIASRSVGVERADLEARHRRGPLLAERARRASSRSAAARDRCSRSRGAGSRGSGDRTDRRPRRRS